ncbi:MAG TPA: hypothetical protein DCE18_04390 [Syntrophobacteraceae bacterium]|nr:hypothetical protein [Syntrophobacteraceae bacterium]HBZ54329.1 hypothetical protein [Syntrophobacteraceae bacterium]
MERRRSRRVGREIVVSWQNGQEHSRGATCDISDHGAFVRSGEAVPVNSIVDFEIDPGRGREKVLCRAQVVWINVGQLEGYPPGFGIEFVDGKEKLKGIVFELSGGGLEGY